MNFPDFKSKHKPCREAVEYIETLPTQDCVEILKILIEREKYQWAEWGLARLLPTKDAVEWACICAESVLPIFESKYPDDIRPRKAVETARAGPRVGDAAALAAARAAWAAWAAARAAWAAAEAEAARAAEAAARAARAAEAAARAAWAAAEAAAAWAAAEAAAAEAAAAEAAAAWAAAEAAAAEEAAAWAAAAAEEAAGAANTGITSPSDNLRLRNLLEGMRLLGVER